MIEYIKGFGTALVTPFEADGSLALGTLEHLLHHVGRHTDFLVILGTTGEASTLLDDEKKLIFEIAARLWKGIKPLVFGLGGNNTAALLEICQKPEYQLADAFLSVTPYYTKPSQAGLIKHFETLAERSPKPIILYNVPGRTGVNMLADTTLTLAQHPNIMGVKESSGNIEQIAAIAAGKPADFKLFIGDDPLTVPGIAVGGEGVISVLGNLLPDTFAELTHAALAGNFALANKLWHQMVPLNPLMYEEGNPVGVKAAMAIKGLCNPYVRLPLVAASEHLTHKIRLVLAA